jgi:hypothetical protein
VAPKWEKFDVGEDHFFSERLPFQFPEDDLLLTLVDAFFVHYNSFFLLLHRPSFKHNLAERAHFRDRAFGELLLVVCALGSRSVDDPRVCLPGEPFPRAAGWRWFNQVQLQCRPFLSRARLLDVQLYLLSAMFLSYSSKPHGIWMLLGMTRQMITDVGAHRRTFYPKRPTVHSELWKRAFWFVEHWC